MTSGFYPTLPNSTSIRVLTYRIMPEENRILGCFTIIDLDKNNHPDYEALSYAWGDPTSVTQVMFKEPNLCVGIAQNLADALARLQRDGQAEMVWIDAICIDQRSKTERSQQVRLMGRVFGDAKQVKVWLGSDEDEMMPRAFRVLRTWSNLLHDKSEGKDTLQRFANLPGPLDIRLAKAMKQCFRELKKADSDISELFHIPWFSRVWTTQEVWLARSSVALGGHAAEIPYEILCRAAYWIGRSNEIGCGAISCARIVYVLYTVPQFPIESSLIRRPLTHLMNFSYFEASEKRDHIYGLLAITEIPANVEKHFVVDYRKPVEEVFADATRGIIESSLRLDVLQGWQSYHVDASPSWACDWSSKTWTMGAKMRQSLRQSKAQIGHYIRPDELSLGGRRFGRIIEICDAIVGVSADGLLALTANWYMHCRVCLGKVCIAIQELVEFDRAFIQVMGRGHWDSGSPSNELEGLSQQSFFAYLARWSKAVMLDIDAGHEVAPARKSWAHILQSEHGQRLQGQPGFDVVDCEESQRDCVIGNLSSDSWSKERFFLTDDGMIGSGAGSFIVGDQVCGLFGGATPLILRADGHETGDHLWRLAGTAFIDAGLLNDSTYLARREREWFRII